MGNLKFCTFYLDQIFFGVEVEKVQEVLRFQELTSVPLAPHVICGLMNLRGQIIAVFDLRKRLGLEERDLQKPPMNVVVRSQDEVFSLMVDRIHDVLEVEDEILEPPPDNLEGASKDLISGVYKLKEQLLLVLDCHKIFKMTEESLAAG